jgi:hypothetical protein
MELVAQASDTNACRDAFSQAQSVLEAPIFETRMAETGLESILQDVAEPWRGFVDIVIEVPQIDLPFAKQMTLEKMVEDAGLICVNVCLLNNTVTVEVNDHSKGPTPGGVWLGSTFITRMTNGDWRLLANSAVDGARLQARLAVQDQCLGAPD